MNYLDEAVTKSLDEFMECYKVVDTENIYSIGIEFVPIFRVKQWEEYNDKNKEIERLNNIINELEKDIDNFNVFKEFSFPLMKRWEEEQVKSSIDYEWRKAIKEPFLNKIKELKGDKNNDN